MARHSFGAYVLDTGERRLLRGAEEVRLRGKVFDTLCVLAANAGRLVRKDEILRQVWPDSVVEENNVDHCISQIRRAFGDEELIETVPRQGYRFLPEVRSVETGDELAAFAEAPAPPVRYFTTGDGVRIAYVMGGEGPPIVRAIDWISHIEFEWKNPYARRWLSTIMQHNTLVRYDQRGSGLSDWNVDDFSLERAVRDFEELMDGLGLGKFTLLGSCQGGAVAAYYAAKHPERVTRLILHGAFASGWPSPGDIVAEQFQAMLAMIRSGWGKDNPAFRQLWTSLFMPDADRVQMDWMNELQRITASPENAVQMLSEFPKINIVDALRDVACPTLVLHAKDDAAVPIQEGRMIASRIRGAKLVELPSRNHTVSPRDPAWPIYEAAFREFMEWERT